MLIDTDDLVSVTELARNLSRYVGHASQDGRRVVIMNNNVPTAAIIGMGDLQRLTALEHASFPRAAEPPSSRVDAEQNRPRPVLRELARAPGTAVLGSTLDGVPLIWKLSQHHLLVGQRASGRDSALSAAIATATADSQVPIDLVVATTRPALPMEHSICGNVPIAVHPGIDDRINRGVFTQILEAEIADRTALLTDSLTVSMSDYRATSGTPVADLVVVLDGIDELAAADRDESLTNLLAKLTERGDSLGISVWLSVTNGQWLSAIAADITDRCAVRTRTAVDSRIAVATDAATDLDPGQILHHDSSAGRPALSRGLIAAPDLEQRAALTPSDKPPTTWSLRLNAPVYFDDTEGEGRSAETDDLQLAIGVADTPRRPLLVHLGAGHDHLFFAGDPGSGLSTAVFTLITTAAATYPPDICAFHILDYNADACLEPLAALPNVGAYARAEDQAMRARILGEYERILDTRANAHDGSVSRSDSDPYQRMILVIDDAARCFANTDTDADDLKDRLIRLLRSGPQYGLHVLMTGAPSRIPVKLLTELPATLIFALADTSGSLLGARNIGALVRAIPAGQPGRCVEPVRRTAARVALPYPDPNKNTDRHPVPDPADARRQTVELLARENVEGQQLPQLHTVPDVVPLIRVWESFEEHMNRDPDKDAGLDRRPASVIEPLVGVNVQDWSMVTVPRYAECGHLLVAGDSGSGRTSTLRTLIASLAGRFAPDDDAGGASARFAIIDQSMELIDVADRLEGRGMLLGYGTDRESATRLLDEVATMVTPRIPALGAGLTVEQIRGRTWYSGPEVFVVIDNASVLFGQRFSMSPDSRLDAVLDLAGRNMLGLHVFATLPAAGFNAVRLSNSLVKALESAGAPTLMLSGPAAEGVIWPGTGVRFQARRPGRGCLVDGYSRNRIVQVPWLSPGESGWPGASVE
ncbi:MULTISPECIES: FtsK/SpoIIIE domain-containing protein [Mycobacterium avium complex (MAC)]|uniref:FtsK/SpoIIIE domain-containing protein n=1 Tax=Mycobacterium avium complex (MAC) TaxID=120793 RepID=UPI000A014F18|nr:MULTISPECIES: FtsK/SpoIIIE domain-containing protein [Mycobacterium avium complex (MAC)]UCN12622.1 type II toxin-antitoxin system Phd/YefM family antitoxin [Mycobacterium intracellulare subsp. chimaera]